MRFAIGTSTALSTEGLPKVEPLDKKTSFALCFSGEKFAFFRFFLNMGEWCTAAHARHTHFVYVMAGDVVNIKVCSLLKPRSGLTGITAQSVTTHTIYRLGARQKDQQTNRQ
jgi:hypothetical protein